MICPKCNIEMLSGYLSTGGAIWSDKKHRISINPGSKEKYALKLGVPFMSLHNVESFLCPRCKTIIIDSSNYENNI